MKLIRLADSYDMSELMLLQSLLDGSGIDYVVRHAHISSLYPGIPALGSHVMVAEHDFLRAEQLLHRLRLDVRDVSVEVNGEA